MEEEIIEGEVVEETSVEEEATTPSEGDEEGLVE